MHITFLNPQGNFDPNDSHLTHHPDFGGQLVYVKQVALALGNLGHQVDILTRQIEDDAWPEFAAPLDVYPNAPNVRILRLPAGPQHFLAKEALWPYLLQEWVPNILTFYTDEGRLPDIFTTHYGDGGLCGAGLTAHTGIPFTFTGHSLGAQKVSKLAHTIQDLPHLEAQYHFTHRLRAERLSMSQSAINITSTRQERFEQYSHPLYHSAVDVSDDSRFATIPPGVNLACFGKNARVDNEDAIHTTVQEQFTRDIAASRRDLPVIIASSRLDPKKNHIALVRAFAQNPKIQSRANLILSVSAHLTDPLHRDDGANEIEREVLRTIRHEVIEHNLWGKLGYITLCNQSELAATYRCLAQRPGSLFALTALYEPFGLAPLEAAAAGLPVVVTQNGGPTESLHEGNTNYGILVDPNNPDDIAQGLSRLLSDTMIWKLYAQRGHQRVLDHYTWDRTARGYESVLQRILDERATQGQHPQQCVPLCLRNPPCKPIPFEILQKQLFG